MMKSCVTISLVPSLRGGPWILWDDLTTSCRKATELGFDAVELFTEGPGTGEPGELEALLEETGLSLGAVGTGAGKVLRGWSLTDPDAEVRQKARGFISEMIAFGAKFGAPAIIGSMQGSHGNGVSKDEALSSLGEALEELGETAGAAGVKLIYEPLNRYEQHLLRRQADGVEIIARAGSRLTVITVQRWDDDAVHAASHQARVDKDATLTHVVVTFGGSVVRVNPSVELAGPGSEARLYGLSFADSGQHLESQVYLHHKGPHTVGDVLYKGALQGASARSVWIGDVLIGPDAVGTDSYEANRNLVLTDGARADSIPNLEIETGDIQGAGHASATGRFDDEQLFYLQARGIAEDEARRLVVIGFLSEIVQRIGIPALQDELTAAIERELEDGAA